MNTDEMIFLKNQYIIDIEICKTGIPIKIFKDTTFIESITEHKKIYKPMIDNRQLIIKTPKLYYSRTSDNAYIIELDEYDFFFRHFDRLIEKLLWKNIKVPAFWLQMNVYEVNTKIPKLKLWSNMLPNIEKSIPHNGSAVFYLEPCVILTCGGVWLCLKIIDICNTTESFNFHRHQKTILGSIICTLVSIPILFFSCF